MKKHTPCLVVNLLEFLVAGVAGLLVLLDDEVTLDGVVERGTSD